MDRPSDELGRSGGSAALNDPILLKPDGRVEVTAENAGRWFGAEPEALETIVARFAELRPDPLTLLEPLTVLYPHGFGAEMQTWIRLFERYELEVSDPAEAELKAPGEKLDLATLVGSRGPSWIADFVAFFCAGCVVVQQDQMSFIASLAGTRSGVSRIHYFHPSDWGLWETDPSLSARLFRLLEEEDRPPFVDQRFPRDDATARSSALALFEALQRPEVLPERLDPARLFDRTDWLIRLFLEVGPYDLGEVLQKAAPHARYAEERRWVQDLPHLAAYWLWAHWVFDDPAGLSEMFERTSEVRHPVIAESRRLIARMRAEQPVRVGGRPGAELLRMRDRLREVAPPALLSGGARRRSRSRRRERARDGEEVARARASVEVQARSDPMLTEAVVLLDHLSTGGSVAPGPAPVHGGLAVAEAVDRLAATADERILPLLNVRLRRSLEVEDDHPEAGWGLLEVWAALAPGLEAFERPLDAAARSRIGSRRQRELYRAYARFDDERATRILLEGAERWLEEIDDWIRMAPSEPVLCLFERDTVDTHRIIARVLEEASFTAANWEIAVQAAVAAGRLRSKRAVSGLRRAVELCLGRVGDGSRAAVVTALYLADGAASRDFLWDRFERSLVALERADEVDADARAHDAACLLGGLLPMAPGEARLVEASRRLLDRFALRLHPRARPRPEAIEAVTAVLSGIRRGEVRGLGEHAGRFEDRAFVETSATRAAARTLRELARQIRAES